MIHHADNMNIEFNHKFDYIYADYIYENNDFSWIDRWWPELNEGGVFVAQTDWHTVFECGMKLTSMPGAQFVNKLSWKNEWGNHPKDRFHQCYDDIIIFAKGKHKFYPERVQIPKKTINKKLNPSGRLTKTATAFVDDICLTTTSKERIKHGDKLIRWQKPLALMQRICEPFTDENDWVLDLFAGTATLGVWCLENNRNYEGIEYDQPVYEIAKERLTLNKLELKFRF